MIKDMDDERVMAIVNENAPTDCPIIKGEALWNNISAGINYQEGITVRCGGVGSEACKMCPLNNKEVFKPFFPG